MGERKILESYMRGDAAPNAPVPMEIHNTKKVDMFLCAGHFLASARVIELLRSHKLTGWDTYDIKVTNSRPDTPIIYGLVFRGRLGPYIPDDTINLSTWDRTDFCTFKLGYSPIITSRVKEVFEKENVKGTLYQPMKVMQ
jgi:hypothetical protein